MQDRRGVPNPKESSSRSSAAGAPRQPGALGPNKWWVLATVCTATLMGTMDASIVTISFPALTRVFDTTPSVVVWVALAYQLTVTGTLLTIGRAADIIGRKKVFVTGLLVFTLGLVLCPLSQGILQLIGFRVVQALGAAMTVALGNAILAASFSQEERGRALGLLEAVVGIGLMSGPAVGGILLDTLGWQAIFYLRIPLGIGACIMALLVLREQPRDGPRDRMDLMGSTTLFLGLSSLILAVNQGQGQGWTSPMVIALGIVAVLSLGLFFSIELRAAQPVIDLSLFRVRRFAVTNALLLTSSLAAIAVPFVLPFYLIEALGLSASRSGLVIMTVPLMLFLLSPVSGALSDRFGPRLLITAGLATQSLGYFLLSARGADSAVLSVWPLLILVGLGGGLFSTPNVSALMSAAPRERMGSVSALMPTVRNIGHALGLAMSGAVFASVRSGYLENASTGLAARALEVSAIAAGYRGAFIVAGFIALAALAISLLLGPGVPSAHVGGRGTAPGRAVD